MSENQLIRERETAENSVQTFTTPNYLWLGILLTFIFNFIVFLSWAAFSSHEISKTSALTWTIILEFASVVFFYYFYRISKVIVILDQEGITRKDRPDEKVFLPWDEFGDVRENRPMQQLILINKSTGTQLIVDFEISGFEKIKDKIYCEYEKRMVLPKFPVKFRFHFFSKNAVVITFLSAVYFYAFTYKHRELLTSVDFMLKFIGSWLGCILLEALVSFFSASSSVIIGENEVVLKKFPLKPVFLRYPQIRQIKMDFIESRNGNRFYFITITSEDKRSYKLTYRLGPIPKIYCLLQKFKEMAETNKG